MRTEGQAAAGSAIRGEDYVRAELAVFRRRVDASIETIRKALGVGAIGVSYSGGKDSTVALDLVRTVAPDAPAALFDSGCEIAGTLAMAAHVGASVIRPRLTMPEMARYAGWWGHAAVDPDCDFDAKRMLLEEPSETFVVRNGLRVIAHGIRATESHGRTMHVASRGDLYRGKDGTWVCMPLARWELADVWAYIASRGLRYHPAYDALSARGLHREMQRVSGALGERGAGWGRHEMLRMVDPDSYRRIRAEFPRFGDH